MSGEQAKNYICGYKMAKKDKAVYAPGELSRVRDKLGDLDEKEAKQIAQKLGGEVGYERSEYEEQARQKPQRTRHERVDVKIGDRPSRPRHAVELVPDGESESWGYEKTKSKRKSIINVADDPSVLLKVNYWERIKMDKLAGQPEFEIKSSGQVFYSMISVFNDIPDFVSPLFVNRRMTEYYKKVELLVISTRTMFPRNNARRNERMKKNAPLVYSILDVIRYWDIERISGDLARIQSHPKNAKVGDFADILRAIYRPLFILDRLDMEAHIRGAYKILYKLLYIESPIDAQNKYQELTRTALTAFSGIQRDVRYLLYPLLLKSVSASFVPYDTFFSERKNRIMSFLNLKEDNQISAATLVMQEETKDQESGDESSKAKAPNEQDQKAKEEQGKTGEEETPEEEISEEERARRASEEAEKRTLEKGLQTLDSLFPKAGWDKPWGYPDLFPYYAKSIDLKKGSVNIAPTDPMQQILVLMRVLEELFFALRYVSFGAVPGSSGNMERVDSILGEIVNNWHYFITVGFEKEYLPRMTEYVRILEGSIEERNSQYSKKLVTEMHWVKRLYFLPYYKFDTFFSPSLQKKDTIPVYSKIRTLRRCLGAVAAGIETGIKSGGAEAHAPCDGIDNPWEPYVFQVPNPLSRRLDALLSAKLKTNASLIYFTLAVTTVLDHLVNNEKSWAYNSQTPGPLFRSVKGEGHVPLTGVDEKIDADALFRQSLKQRQKKTDES
jgi:hypothetical protein